MYILAPGLYSKVTKYVSNLKAKDFPLAKLIFTFEYIFIDTINQKIEYASQT